MISRSHFKTFLSMFFVLLLVFLNVHAGFSRGEFGVPGTIPTFLDTSIVETGELIFVNVSLFSLNGLSAIDYVNVTVKDDQGSILSNVRFEYNMTEVNGKIVEIINWNQTAGQYINEDESSSNYWYVPPYNLELGFDSTGLNVSFSYKKFSGDSISIVCADKYGRSSRYEGPFSSIYTPKPVFPGAVIPVSLSALVAGVAAVLMAFRRHSNNKLAKAVEASQLASGED